MTRISIRVCDECKAMDTVVQIGHNFIVMLHDQKEIMDGVPAKKKWRHERQLYRHNRLNLYIQKEKWADENYIDKIACIHQLEVNEK